MTPPTPVSASTGATEPTGAPVGGTGTFRAYEALSGALRAAVEPHGVQVLDGPRVAEDLQDDVLLVGYGAEAALTVTHERVGLGARTEETFELRCLLSSASGDTDLTARRARLADVLDVVVALISLARPLADTVDRLRLGENLEMLQEQTTDGSVAELSFSILGRILR